ncbi:MAG: 4Fe-4S dicluster domain-containing protein, partial [Planctomycetia bacterium]
MQPLIAPLYADAFTPLGLLSGLLDAEPKADLDVVRDTFKVLLKDDAGFDAAWQQVVHDGVWKGSAPAAVTPKLNPITTTVDPDAAKKAAEIELIFAPHPTLLDGRFANNGWLQETPDFVSKLTWDNALLMSPATAAKLGLANQTLADVKFRDRTVKAPVLVLPGPALDSVTLYLGYGRTHAGHVGGSVATGVAPVGVDAYKLRDSFDPDFAYGAAITPTGVAYPLATTQDHHGIDAVGLAAQEQRLGELIREGSLEEYKKHPDFAEHKVHHPPLLSLWTEPTDGMPGKQWGMAIDLTKCTGCNACLVACQAENNIPIVGKDQVLRGREMHWIRVDRYFSGSVEEPTLTSQVVTCMHCETAPCEQVCPVAATVHTSDGLNHMIYNRCVGTRYCANNCPYKVRRFNYFNYHKELDDPRNDVQKLSYNPEVTVRSRGVMEKCTFCVQRIEKVKIKAKNERRAIEDGEVTTACAQTCPAEAIVFGDLS